MKKTFLLGVLVISLLTSSMQVFATTSKHPTTIDGYSISSVDYNGEPMIAIRDLENYGFSVSWDEYYSRVLLFKDCSEPTYVSSSKEDIKTENLVKMNDTYTINGNIQTYSINGSGYMYFKDLQKFGTVQGYNVVLDDICMDFTIPCEEGEYIKGDTTVPLEIAKQWAMDKGADQRFIDIAESYWKYASMTGLRAEVMYAQAAFETGFGTYKGNVVPSQNNWAGIKTRSATGDRTYDHECFVTPDDGVRGHYNHMLAYTGGTVVGIPHGRYYSVSSMPWAGTVEKVEDLSGKWCPRADYSQTIIKFLSEMYSYC